MVDVEKINGRRETDVTERQQKPYKGRKQSEVTPDTQHLMSSWKKKRRSKEKSDGNPVKELIQEK